jgi:hypothetical protein
MDGINTTMATPIATVLQRLRWPVYGNISDIEIIESDEHGEPYPNHTKPFSNLDGSQLHPIAL